MAVTKTFTFAELFASLSTEIAVTTGTFMKLIVGSAVVYVNVSGPDELVNVTSPIIMVKGLSETYWLTGFLLM